MATNERPRDMVPADEVQAIIARGVAEQVALQVEAIQARIEERIKAAMEASGAAVAAPGADKTWMAELAMQFASLADQGSGKIRIAPEEMTKRSKARDRMADLIADAIANSNEPAYRLRSMVYLGDRKIPPIWIDREHRQQPTEIGWYGVPNEAMEPANDAARAIYAAFGESIGATTQRATGPMRITAGGLTILKGAQFADPATDQAPVAAPMARNHLEPTIRGRGAPPSRISTHVLGTIMPPAMQQA